jgi:hypothetical protein
MTEICGMTPEARVLRKKDLAVRSQRIDAFLNARSARVVQANQRRAVLVGQIHQLGDFAAVRLAQRAAQNGKILGEDIYRAPVDFPQPVTTPSVSGMILLHPKTHRAVGDAVFFPRACCLLICASPPPNSAFLRIASSCALASMVVEVLLVLFLFCRSKTIFLYSLQL